jgi:L-alanine-DL-glutamate epimerase-like enolase superfamily enzyme
LTPACRTAALKYHAHFCRRRISAITMDEKLADDLTAVEVVRSAVGADIRLMVDSIRA